MAEKKLLFGGMLGSTFNFVFEAQLEALQNGDRFYYLSRLANLNLTAQLENNKFSEMIHRNTTATHLPGDAFARPDFFLEVDKTKQFNLGLGLDGNDDPTGETIDIDPFLGAASGGNAGAAVIRSNVTINSVAYSKLEFTGAEHVVLGGTERQRLSHRREPATTRCGVMAATIASKAATVTTSSSVAHGNDIITDLFGIDEIRSNAGDDVVSVGRGIKLIITDTGNDWVWGGVDDDEVLAGQGNDFVNGGDGQDFIIGGEGNDWLESGTENGLMLGDNGDLVQGLPIKRSVDSRIVGHDVLLATGGNADFDAETGDDIMVGGLGTDRFFGQFGFDWATYKNDPFGLEADMNNRLFSPPSLPASPGAILDRYAQTEALSGSAKSDILRGDDETDLAGGAAALWTVSTTPFTTSTSTSSTASMPGSAASMKRAKFASPGQHPARRLVERHHRRPRRQRPHRRRQLVERPHRPHRRRWRRGRNTRHHGGLPSPRPGRSDQSRRTRRSSAKSWTRVAPTTLTSPSTPGAWPITRSRATTYRPVSHTDLDGNGFISVISSHPRCSGRCRTRRLRHGRC